MGGIPVVLLGAGQGGHGVHIITSDLMGLYEEHTPRHSKVYHNLIPVMEKVFTDYMNDVKEHRYPGPEHTVYMKDENLLKFAQEMKWDSKLEQIGRAQVELARQNAAKDENVLKFAQEMKWDSKLEQIELARQNAGSM